MSLTYKILKKQAVALSIIFSCLPLLPLTFINLVWIPSSAADEMYVDLPTLVFAWLCMMPICALMAYFFLKKTTLTIDTKGIRTSNKLLNMMPNSSEILFDNIQEVQRLDNFVKSITGKSAIFEKRLSTHDSALVFIDKKYKKFIISDNAWDIDNISEIEEFLHNIGITIKKTDVQDFVKEHTPQLSNLGKKAKFFAYTGIVIIVMCIFLPILDDWSTIYYGSAFKYFLWAIFVIFSVMSFMVMKKNQKYVFAYITPALLFGAAITFLYLLVVLMIVPVVGKKVHLTFEYEKMNNSSEEIWVAKEDSSLKIFCRKADVDIGTIDARPPQTTHAKQFTSIIRVHGKELCKNSTFLNDGMLPHD